MKLGLIFLIILSCSLAFGRSQDTSSGVIWNLSLEADRIISDVHNNLNEPQICSMDAKISLLNERGLVRGFKTVSFSDYIILNTSTRTFSLNKSDMNVEDLEFGEISLVSVAPRCRSFDFSNVQIASAMSGALRNSDFISAQYFLSLSKNSDKIKFINVSGSFFNLNPNVLPSLNHIEHEKTTFLLKTTSGERSCEMRRSLKCGGVFFEESSSACGVESYNRREHSSCGCKTREGGPCTGGCDCKTYKTCERPEFGVRSWKSCRDPSHGVEDVKACALKVNDRGEFEDCAF